MSETPFWIAKRFSEMSEAEWESLCDGCGQCCLHKLEDVDTGEIALTDVACRYLDLGSCRCTDYANRTKNVPDCVRITPDNAGALKWMPQSCAYRLVAEGKPLNWWHPLVSGDPESVHEAGVSVRGKAIDEDRVDDLHEHVIDWLNMQLREGTPPLAAPRPGRKRGGSR